MRRAMISETTDRRQTVLMYMKALELALSPVFELVKKRGDRATRSLSNLRAGLRTGQQQHANGVESGLHEHWLCLMCIMLESLGK